MIGFSTIANNNRPTKHFGGIWCIGSGRIYHYLVTTRREFCYIELCIIHIFHGKWIIGVCFYVELYPGSLIINTIIDLFREGFISCIVCVPHYRNESLDLSGFGTRQIIEGYRFNPNFSDREIGHYRDECLRKIQSLVTTIEGYR